MIEYQIVLTLIGIAIASVRYALYFHGMWKGEIRPHVFSWFVWAVIAGIEFGAQFVSGGGPGAWITAYVAFMCFVISIAALFRGTKDITKTDWFCFIAAFIAIGLWLATKTPLYSLIIAIVADGLGYVPTLRKSIKNPNEESGLGFALASSRSVFGILALASFNFMTLAAQCIRGLTSVRGDVSYTRRLEMRPVPR